MEIKLKDFLPLLTKETRFAVLYKNERGNYSPTGICDDIDPIDETMLEKIPASYRNNEQKNIDELKIKYSDYIIESIAAGNEDDIDNTVYVYIIKK